MNIKNCFGKIFGYGDESPKSARDVTANTVNQLVGSESADENNTFNQGKIDTIVELISKSTKKFLSDKLGRIPTQSIYFGENSEIENFIGSEYLRSAINKIRKYYFIILSAGDFSSQEKKYLSENFNRLMIDFCKVGGYSIDKNFAEKKFVGE